MTKHRFPLTAPQRLALALLATATLLSAPAWAQHSDAERQEDIRRHRAMAAAHAAAAQCLADPKQSEKTCLEALQKDCKGLALGKYCGMRHAH